MGRALTAPILVVIPVLGRHVLTRQLLDDLHQERHLADVLIVDNGGDYLPSGVEHVLRPHENIGWLRGCNIGMEYAFQNGYSFCMLLNNDTRLSPKFIESLVAVAEVGDLGICGPMYDDVWPHQQLPYACEASEYHGTSSFQDVPFIDGTCMLIPRRSFDVVGVLDERLFGKYGWAADFDYSLRLQACGLKTYVAKACYLNHAGQATASLLDSNYSQTAVVEAENGMLTRYGENWEDLLGDGDLVRRIYRLARDGALRNDRVVPT